MKVFFWKIIQAIGKISIFKNFAKPISSPNPTTTYQNLKIEAAPVIIESFSSFETTEEPENSVQTEMTAVAVLPKVICLPSSMQILAGYDIQNTPVAEPVKTDEEFTSVPIRIIKSAEITPAKANHKLVRARKTSQKTAPAKSKSAETIKKIPKKSKPRNKKKAEAPIPPEATGFGFQKAVAVGNASKK